MIDELKERLLAVPELAGWPQARALVARLEEVRPMSSLEYPLLAAEAVGGERRQAYPAAAAVFCLQTAIHLVDDMLDLEADGLYRQLGEGRTANLALALQAAGLRLIDDAGLSAGRRAAVLQRLAAMSLATAYGQDRDLEPAAAEAGYWQVVGAKTPPLFAAALFSGAVMGGAPLPTARRVEALGQEIGMIIQINDDLHDAMEVPAKPDWRRPGNNLPILYAATAEHDERRRFLDLLPRVGDRAALEQAQEILVTSGAMSYCCYHVIEHYRRARRRIDALSLPRAGRLRRLLAHHVEPLRALLRRVGVEQPDALLDPP